MTRPVRSTLVILMATAATVLAGTFVFRAAPQTPPAATTPSEFSLDGPFAYTVEYLGVTCGHMVLESRLEDYRGRPAYHVIMTARNSNFFNKIYRVDGRIDSWVDAETMTTIFYTSDITEKGERKIRRYDVDRKKGVIVADKHGEVAEIPYDGSPALDPLAFVYRGRALANPGTKKFSLNLLTDRGAITTDSLLGERKRFGTYDGKRDLQKVQPVTDDGEMFSKKGEFIYWIDPGPATDPLPPRFQARFRAVAGQTSGTRERTRGPADRGRACRARA